MTQEEKQLLLKDLSARLPYGVMIQFPELFCPQRKVIEKLVTINDLWRFNDDGIYIENIKPYLRPMSSMTEEEKVQLSQYACIGENLNGKFIDEVQRKDCAAYIDWLNKNHFDYRELIKKGLALEAPEGMY